MIKAYKYRIYPTIAQKVLLDKHLNCCRFIYNLALETKEYAYKSQRVRLSSYDLQKQMTQLRKEYNWLREVSYGSLANAIADLDVAYKNYFNGGCEYPKFKNKSDRQSYTVKQSLKLCDGLLYIEKLTGGVRIRNHRDFTGIIKRATISKTTTGKYFASLCVSTFDDIPDKLSINTNSSIGIDLGIKTFAVLSTGDEIANPRHLQNSLQRLKVLQRRVSRKKKGSNNRKAAILKVAILHERITNQRTHFLHTVSHEITNRYDTICIEDLNIAGMMKNHTLAQSISSASWGSFVTMLKYKSEWHGKNLIQIGRFEASTKACSGCGLIKDMPLSERAYNCACGLSLSRDHNAAINIKNSGMRRAVEPVESSSIDGAKKQESEKKFTSRYHKRCTTNKDTQNS